MLTLTVRGDVSEYADTSNLQRAIAEAAGVDVRFVSIRVAAASVLIIATIAVPASTTAAAVQTALSSSLGTAAAASAQLGIPVESAPTISVVDKASPPPASEASDGSSAVTIPVAAAGGAGALVLALLLLAACRKCRKQATPWTPVQVRRGPHGSLNLLSNAPRPLTYPPAHPPSPPHLPAHP